MALTCGVLWKAADGRQSPLTGSLQQPGHCTPFSFGLSSVLRYVLKQGKAPASVAPSFLSWLFSGQDQWARATLVRCQLARKELTDPFIGLAMKDEGKESQ